ncbi:hypothetical protein [Tumebacillus permanentifrigoris]|uniref:Uncharacterized protein n=1 Tax=Tumebacillus permanentifrigoris TaxID=378543 RepID=A0A316D8A4_9BACL|nr:hypothetical protein [Tumebacillus permanentifrigoris]PWK13016.1 hypothetical protein C7459_10834 [Tumebacillus permanentifrigoris]
MECMQRLTDCEILEFSGTLLVTDAYSIGFSAPLFFGRSLDSLEALREEHLPALLHRRITDVQVEAERQMILTVEDAGLLVLSLQPEEQDGSEAAVVHFNSGEIILIAD